MRSGQIIRVEFFTPRLFVLCETLVNNTMSKSLTLWVESFPLATFCFESLQKKKKKKLLTNPGYFTFLTYFSNCTSIANLEQLSIISCVCACGGENSLQIRTFVWQGGGGKKRLCQVVVPPCTCVCLLKTQKSANIWGLLSVVSH